MAATISVKKTAHELIDNLPDNASWDDVLYEMLIRKEIELGLADSEDGRVTAVEDIREEYGL